ncbi:methyltransferase domain-containing protein [Candidatus Dependentiae bacterium]|nr:methyltransferase domain-containing protein [Candidatus Dependentiae bacterium]MBU4387560.1 methyltransferase domain-containing protein [Candidatus Dependentiae bacterium]MCG2756635.1 methyltransferase domain-containing protein [Candidatus Dependentiae bacterium]
MKKARILWVLFGVIVVCIFCNLTFFKETAVFIGSFFSKPKSVGAVIPSSSFLAMEITKYINNDKGPIKILEVGAGTGVITSKIAEKLGPSDQFDVVELDQDFCKILKEKFKNNSNININCESILDWSPDYGYDYIISGLPFNSFSSDFLHKILNKYRSLILPGGIISYFEYIALAKVKLFFLFGQDKNNFEQTITTTTNFLSQFEFESKKIFANIPPAYVHHLLVD